MLALHPLPASRARHPATGEPRQDEDVPLSEESLPTMATTTNNNKISEKFSEIVTTRNFEGAPTHGTTNGETLIRYLMLGFMGNTYYSGRQTLDAQAIELFEQFAKHDPEFLAQAIVYAREKGLLRLAPLTALVVLSKQAPVGAYRSMAQAYFHLIFRRVVKTPGDLQDVALLCLGHGNQVSELKDSPVQMDKQSVKALRGFGPTMRKAIARWLADISEYHVIKYGSEKQELSLRDLYRLAHPKGLTGQAQAIARYVTKGAIFSEEAAHIPQIIGYDTFKVAAKNGSFDATIELITRHKLPWEVIPSNYSNLTTEEQTTLWTTMARQMPHMALLRNLNNLLKYGVLNDLVVRSEITAKLTDPHAVKNGKQFPFRYFSAIKQIEASENGSYIARQEVLAALNTALYHAVTQNMPTLPGETFIALDVSDSMNAVVNATPGAWMTRAQGNEVSCKDIGALFAAGIYLSAEKATVVAFDNVVHARGKLSRSGDIKSLMSQIKGRESGGTALHEAISYATATGNHYRNLILITDNESWVGEMGGGDSTAHYGYGWQRRGTTSQQKVQMYLAANPEANFYFVNLMPYPHRVTPNGMARTHYVSGWSNEVLSFIGLTSSGEMQLDKVSDIVI